MVLDAYPIKPKDYTFNQLRYDLRILGLRGLIERVPKSSARRYGDRTR
jgi:hypothetical protein